jgi:uncharacterized coiled-coil DUF342 family protein
MSSSGASPLQRQIARVSRRLFLQTLLTCLLWCWAGALLLSAAWFLVQPHLGESLTGGWRWGVPASLLGSATLLGLALGIVHAPPKVAAALLLDERFSLKERVTTSLTLEPHLATSPAGQALMADVNQRIGQLDIGSRFPLRVSRFAVLTPIGAMLLAVLASWYQPTSTQASPEESKDEKAPVPAAAKAEIAKKMNDLTKKKTEKLPKNKEMAEDLKQIEAKLEQIANRPRDTKEQLRDRIKEMTALEDALKNREKELADKNLALKQQLQNLDKITAKETPKDGPAKDLEKALAQGKLEQAKQELEKLADKLSKDKLTAKEKEQLAKQLKDIQDKLERAAKQKDKEENLKKLIQEAKANKRNTEALQRELDKVRKDQENLKDLQDLANAIGQCRKCMQAGDAKAASDKMKQAAGKIGDMDLADKDFEDLQEQLQRLQDAKGACCQGTGEGEGNQEQGGNGMKGGGPPGGKRPVAAEGNLKPYDSQTKSPFDPKGKKIFEGYAPGQNFRGKSSLEMEGEIKQAAQEAPEAIESQRYPKAAQDMVKGYFRNLGGQKEKEAKKESKP